MILSKTLKQTIHNCYNHLKKIMRWINMRAAYWTAIGTMLIPIGVVVLIEYQNLNDLAVVLMIAGLLSFIAGWFYTIKGEKEASLLRQEENKRNIKEHKENLIMMFELANKNNLSTTRLKKLIDEITKEEDEDEKDFKKWLNISSLKSMRL